MNIAYIHQRIEIVFWNVSITLMKALMRDRRSLRLLTFTPFLILILVLSPLALSAFFQPKASAAELRPINRPPALHLDGGTLNAARNGQRNFLIVMVDQLDARSPRLEGVWLLLYIPSTPPLTLLPLYPASLGGGPDQDRQMESSFRLTGDRLPDESFLDHLSSHDLWWSNIIVIDQIALAGAIELFGGVDLGSGRVNGIRAIASLPKAAQDPKGAVQAQAGMIKSLCQRPAQLPSAKDLLAAYQLFSDHLSLDFKVEAILEDWHLFKGIPACEFPTLTPAAANTPAP
jgi:hypothetical protein